MASTPAAPAEATFTTVLIGEGGKIGLSVPPEVIAILDAGHRPPVAVTINGHTYRSTVAVMGGDHLVGVNAAARAAAGVQGGDTVEVTLRLDTSLREVNLSDDFAAALAARPAARAFYDTLPNSLQRFHAENVNGAKTPETRARRIDKAVALFLAGKKR